MCVCVSVQTVNTDHTHKRGLMKRANPRCLSLWWRSCEWVLSPPWWWRTQFWQRIALSLLLPYINEPPIRITLYYIITLKNRTSSQKFSRNKLAYSFLTTKKREKNESSTTNFGQLINGRRIVQLLPKSHLGQLGSMEWVWWKPTEIARGTMFVRTAILSELTNWKSKCKIYPDYLLNSISRLQTVVNA